MSTIKSFILLALFYLAKICKGLPPDDYYMHKQFFPRIQKRIIVDTDSGLDDIQALVMLIDADNKGFLKIEALIVSEGRTSQQFGIRNVFRLLEAADRLDIPVYKGSKHPLMPHEGATENKYGRDGFGDLNWIKEPPVFLLKHNLLGPGLIKDLAYKYPKEISVITLGPLTNLALSLRMYENVAENIKEVFAMGGLFNDETGDEGEFNVVFDPEAAEIVLAALDCPMYLFTLQGCSFNVPQAMWFENATLANPVYNMMMSGEAAVKINDSNWLRCDAGLAAVFLDSTVVLNEHSSYLKAILGDGSDRGIVEEFNSTEAVGKRRKVVLIDEINYDRMKRLFLEGFHDICFYHNCQRVC